MVAISKMNPLRTVANLWRRQFGPDSPHSSPWRRTTNRGRCLPDFIIIGAQRCGTTSLYEYIIQHPAVCAADKKEVHFFDNHYAQGLGWYRAHFPWKSIHDQGQITGEASPYYLCHPHAAGRIARDVPHAKLIAVLRDPAERAVSHYFHNRKRGTEALTLPQALAEEASRVEPEYQRMLADERHRSRIHQEHSYRARGLYADQIANWLAIFPATQLHVLCSEDVFANPAAELQKIFAFLGIATDFVPPSLDARNTGDNRQAVEEAISEELRSYFAPHNERLFAMLGKRFPWPAAGRVVAPAGGHIPSPRVSHFPSPGGGP